MLKIQTFNKSYTQLWDEFVLNAKNAHFMFCRNYMDYHADRFQDHSLMFFENDKLIALLPANLQENILHSHQGLTFGGIISNIDMTASLMLDAIDTMVNYLRKNQITKLIYKSIPYIYFTNPSQEDLYALFNKGAKLIKVDSLSTINLEKPPKFSDGRKYCIKKAMKAGLKVVKSDKFEVFYEILANNLKEKYNAAPTHTLQELQLLASRFPQNISLFCTVDQNHQLLAGVILFEMNQWVHTQYIAASCEGKKTGALDLLFDELINKTYVHLNHFDFGASTKSNCTELNQGVVNFKEGFGASTVAQHFFELGIEHL